MYRRVLSFYQGRNVLSQVQDPRPLPSKCSSIFSALVFRSAGNVSPRAFGTGVPCYEKGKGTTSPPQEEVKNDREQTTELQAEDAEPKLEERAEAGAKVRSHTEEQKNIEAAPTAAADHEQAEKLRTGKQGLLELLGAMKVDGTTKRKLKALKTQRKSEEAPHGPRLGDMESTISMFQQATSEATRRSESLSVKLHAAASAVAATLPDSVRTESELLTQLRKHEAVSDAQSKDGRRSLNDIIAHMKVRKKFDGRPNTRSANQIHFDDDGKGYTHERSISGELDGVRKRKSPFTGKRLNIFVGGDQEKDTDLATRPTLWDIDLANQIAEAVNNRPRNGFEEMIKWTREGKLWHYPINNEAGMEEEASVPFHEHVFLEHHLVDGFPQQGPIRRFMELVIVGLAKNPHLSVKEKVEHIAWFRDYFKEKQDILKEAEAYVS